MLECEYCFFSFTIENVDGNHSKIFENAGFKKIPVNFEPIYVIFYLQQIPITNASNHYHNLLKEQKDVIFVRNWCI